MSDHKLISGYEECGSVVGYGARVRRYSKVSLTGFDDIGQRISMNASDFTARVIQHEMDHLNGIMLTDVMNPKSLTCCCWQAVNQYGGNIKLQFLLKPRRFYY